MNKYEKYYQMAKSNSGVLFIQGRPAEAKSAIVKKIAELKGLKFFDLRLSQMDETDIGLFPTVNKEEKCIDHLPPRWAIEANKQPSLIFFDELNRAKLDVRNAALQLLLDRQIGYNFEFNDNVIMMSAGNFGEEDGTEVEEMDTALWNRLIAVKHELSIKEWVDQYAKENVWDFIVKFVESNPSEFYKTPSENCKAYATPRSWTFLSDFVKSVFGGFENVELKNAISLLKDTAYSYVGNSSTKFLRYLEDMYALNITDILDRYEQVEDEVKKMNRTRVAELMKEVESLKLDKLKTKQIDNLIKFLGIIDADELAGLIFYIIDEDMGDNGKCNSKNCNRILEAFDTQVRSVMRSYE
jgi:MoxR-like ATPase